METWEDVNARLRRMGELVIKKAIAATAFKRLLDEGQAAFDKVKGPADKEYEKLEAEVVAFAKAHKAEFIGKTRKKKLSFGEVSFKLSSGSVEFKLSEELVIVNLRKQGHGDCIREIEQVDKEAVKNLDAKDLLKAGIEIKKDDNCTVRPDLKKIQEEVAA